MNEDIKIYYHGLHVLDNKFIEGCPYCKQRAILVSVAKLQGKEPIKAVSDAALARRVVDSINKKS